MFKVDFINGEAVTWRKRNGKIEKKHAEYSPRFYIEGDKSKLQKSRAWLSSQREVEATCFETWKPTLSKEAKDVLRIDTQIGGLRSVVNRLKKNVGRSTFRYYNVGLSPQFRYCLQKEICPLPEEELTRARLEMTRKEIADENFSELRFNGEKLGDNPVETFKRRWRGEDPDIVFVSRTEVLRIVQDKMQFRLGRATGFEKLAGENIVSSYGKTVYSAPRYNIPGRILVDEENSFLLGEATIEGMWYLVEKSYRPLQELAWGSIGRLLTSIEIRKAYLEENTLTPWKNWRGEEPKKASTMHRADRGGFIFNPEPGIHEDVYEADFASLFPNIMVKKNISPETVCCDCCGNSKVPELEYSICEKHRGFISQVLKPLVEERQRMKEEAEQRTGREKKILQGKIDAIKWLLVSCFGYMGHAHASYGAIECHQAIQAFDREIMVKTKEMFEEHGYSVVHGIIDSIWVQKEEDARNFEEVCSRISDEIGIKLEPEHRFEWCAFVPRSSSNADIATLNRYFGKKQNGEFKTAGIEVEQKSVCDFVKESQMEMIRALDNSMSTKQVFQVLENKISRLESMKVSTDDLVKHRKVSKPLEDYRVDNFSTSAIRRSRKHGIEVKPGQSVSFVVIDHDAGSTGKTRLKFEAETYDSDYYVERLLSAAGSVLSPLGLSRNQIQSSIENKLEWNLSKFS